MKILVIVAHPDDEILGMGGTIIKHLDNNDEVSIMLLSRGIDDNQYNDFVCLYDSYLNRVEKTYIEDLPDNEFDRISMLTIIKKIEKVLEKVKPDIIYTHSSSDLNIDHRIVYQAVLTANRPCNSYSAKEIYGCEIISSTEWNYPIIFSPNVFIEIDIEKKLKAMSYYGSQLKGYYHPRSLQGIKIRAEYWGTVALKRYCEVFELIRMVK